MEQKKTLRQIMMKRRKELASGTNPPANLLKNFITLFPEDFWQNKIISFYYPIGSEISPLAILSWVAEKNATPVLPKVIANNAPLQFHQYNMGDHLITESFGTKAPQDDKPICEPNIMVIPLLAFDKKKYRLGYGGGFYDRTIAELKKNTTPITIGLAWQGQMITDLPCESHDQPLDYIVTEEAIIK